MGITEDANRVNTLRSYLNFKSRIEITDGRIFHGTFVCVDKQKNIILAQAEEYRQGKEMDDAFYPVMTSFSTDEKRLVGLIMIPGKHLVKVEVEDLDII
ncbi:hypothetical protein DM01DRAFT_1293472 [Hesseltinella vesiculosa]|uniref:Sm domain-containing protein n=1 Tax=Hesseltinella vesiculosa TaxID=101127 RepID=A0A1X2G745_9FUNG|nr:hypothetical protein DM01DRAFT_1293472 [Hesseltinella vesiculosa]